MREGLLWLKLTCLLVVPTKPHLLRSMHEVRFLVLDWPYLKPLPHPTCLVVAAAPQLLDPFSHQNISCLASPPSTYNQFRRSAIPCWNWLRIDNCFPHPSYSFLLMKCWELMVGHSISYNALKPDSELERQKENQTDCGCNLELRVEACLGLKQSWTSWSWCYCTCSLYSI